MTESLDRPHSGASLSSVTAGAAYPVPPPEFIRRTCGHESPDEFLKSGAEVVQMFEMALRGRAGQSLVDFQSILDFGCGCGRLARFIEPAGLYHGCDIHAGMIEFNIASFPGRAFYVNDDYPPLNYREGSFDLVLSFSVFSHLRLDVERSWLRELRRVGAAGCIYLLTVHGEWFIEQILAAEEKKTVRRDGFFYKQVHGRGYFPEYYEASFHTEDYVRSVWDDTFEIIDVIKGDRADRYTRQGLAFEGPEPRPMGQDLVIARKRRPLVHSGA